MSDTSPGERISVLREYLDGLVRDNAALRTALRRLRIAQHRMDDAWLDGDNTARALAQLELQGADEEAAAVLGGAPQGA